MEGQTCGSCHYRTPPKKKTRTRALQSCCKCFEPCCYFTKPFLLVFFLPFASFWICPLNSSEDTEAEPLLP